MKRFCLALDLQDDAAAIAEYDRLHQAVWPENIAGIKAAGITEMQIFRTGNRLCMIIETTDDFTFARKAELDATNQKVQEWEALTWQYQQPLPWAKEGEKWVLMEKIFQL